MLTCQTTIPPATIEQITTIIKARDVGIFLFIILFIFYFQKETYTSGKLNLLT